MVVEMLGSLAPSLVARRATLVAGGAKGCKESQGMPDFRASAPFVGGNRLRWGPAVSLGGLPGPPPEGAVEGAGFAVAEQEGDLLD